MVNHVLRYWFQDVFLIKSNDKSLQQIFNFYLYVAIPLSLFLSLFVLLPLILLSQWLPPCCVDNNLHKTPCRKYIVLDPRLQQRLCSKALLPFWETWTPNKWERLQGTLLIHWHSLVSPTLDLSDLEGGASRSMKTYFGTYLYLFQKCHITVVSFHQIKVFKIALLHLFVPQ